MQDFPKEFTLQGGYPSFIEFLLRGRNRRIFHGRYLHCYLI